ncbi:MAG: hypothetical protein DRP16_04640 [Candidatus Aenigmatarchaeota archaeon]|nr:MAG: hypothetical protein DRP16_04640 [Candidatus Aenigmarchaeota archaeon]
MAELVIKIPEELEREVETWGVDLQPLFLAFLRHEFDKIKRFESAVKESKSESELKKLADEMDEEVLWILADKILSKSKLTEKQANKLAEELKERVAKRHGLV